MRRKNRFSYKVVAFMVNVKLVEKRVNRNVGAVNVKNEINQNATPGMTLMKNSVQRPTIPYQDPDEDGMPCWLASATAASIEAFTALDKLAKLCAAAEGAEEDMANCGCLLALLTGLGRRRHEHEHQLFHCL